MNTDFTWFYHDHSSPHHHPVGSILHPFASLCMSAMTRLTTFTSSRACPLVQSVAKPVRFPKVFSWQPPKQWPTAWVPWHETRGTGDRPSPKKVFRKDSREFNHPPPPQKNLDRTFLTQTKEIQFSVGRVVRCFRVWIFCDSQNVGIFSRWWRAAIGYGGAQTGSHPRGLVKPVISCDVSGVWCIRGY